MKNKKLVSLVLAFVLVFSTSITAFANNGDPSSNTSSEENASVVIIDEGVYINGEYYTQEQFIQLLDTAVEIETPQTRSAVALIAGTWWIPGVGEVVITVAGVILVGGAVIAVGTWIYNAVVSWFETRAFNQSAENAVNNCDSNKRNHIMQSKHNWNKFQNDPNWSDVAPILIKVLKEGSETWETNHQYIRTLVYKGETVVVRFIKDAQGLVQYISTAWCE